MALIALLIPAQVRAANSRSPYFSAQAPSFDDPQAVQKIQQMPFDAVEAERLWHDTLMDRLLAEIKEENAGLGHSDVDTKTQAERRLERYKKSLSADEFDQELMVGFEAYKQQLVALLDGSKAPPAKQPDHRNDVHKKTFETMVITFLANSVTANVEGAKRESGDLAKGLRAVTGISVKDIQERGWQGGDNSFARHPEQVFDFLH